jgi:hypothetical protein
VGKAAIYGLILVAAEFLDGHGPAMYALILLDGNQRAPNQEHGIGLGTCAGSKTTSRTDPLSAIMLNGIALNGRRGGPKLPFAYRQARRIDPSCCDHSRIKMIADTPFRAHVPGGGIGIIPGNTYACKKAITPISAAPAIE